jgi:hypothetical protein
MKYKNSKGKENFMTSDPQHNLIACVGCGAMVADIDGATHRYLGASAGCWALYGEVLACEYQDMRYMKVHNLTVDAYTLQHIGTPSPQTIQSAAVHLMSLYVQIEHDADQMMAIQMRQRGAAHKGSYHWLTPPDFLGEITIADIYLATTPDDHEGAVRAWAQSVWQAWSVHHAIVKAGAGV